MRPFPQLVNSPLVRFFGMTGRTRVRNAVLFGHHWRNELKGMAPDVNRADGSGDLRHVTGYALTAFRILRVACVGLNRTRWPWLQLRLVTGQTHFITRRDEVGIEFCAVNIVATGAGDTLYVHAALDIVITLHPVLVCRAIGPVRKRFFSKMDLIQFPMVTQA